METITGHTFETVEGAGKMLVLVQKLSEQQLIDLGDAAIVTWPQGNNKPTTRHLDDVAGSGALDEAFWGMLFGLIFFVPFYGMAFSASMGALVGHFGKYGIDKRFVRQVQEKVTEGTSALFLMTTEAATTDTVTCAAKTSGFKFDVVCTNLSNGQEQQLHDDFGE